IKRKVAGIFKPHNLLLWRIDRLNVIRNHRTRAVGINPSFKKEKWLAEAGTKFGQIEFHHLRHHHLKQNVCPRTKPISSAIEYSGAEITVLKILFTFVKPVSLGGGPSKLDSQSLTVPVLFMSGIAGGSGATLSNSLIARSFLVLRAACSTIRYPASSFCCILTACPVPTNA